MKRLSMIAAAAALATGCMSTESGQSVEIMQSGFDNATVVHIEPHGGSCKNDCLGLGAQWSDQDPTSVFIFVKNWFDYVAIHKARLNIDGEIVELQRNQLTTQLDSTDNHMRTSQKAFVTPLDTVDKILSAKRVWLQIETNNGNLEDMIIDGETDTKAFHALQRFRSNIKST